MYSSINDILFLVGYSLIFLGIIIIVLAMFMFVFKSIKGKTETKGGGIIFIGPIPVIFGTDVRIAKWLIIFALIITLILFAIAVLHLL